jgi:ATP-dependent Clp protease ATP-binding subunit ClpC
MSMWWEPFNERARRTVVLAQMVAERLGSNYIGTGHLLLGIITARGSHAAIVLEALGAGSLSKVREGVEAIVSPDGRTGPDEMNFTPCAERAIQFAAQEAARLSHVADTDYLLLGLISEGDFVAARVLTDLGVAPAEVRVQLGKSA